MHELREYHLLDELRAYHFFDLKVYRRAAAIVSHGRPLYATKLRHGLGFTYPPIAVLMFLSLRWLSVRGDELAVTIVNIALLAVIAHAALRLQRPRAQREGVRSRDARRRWRLIAAGWLAAAAALWVEPVMTTLGYGQIDLLITALVVVDLVYGRSSRAGGLGIGLAAALKLTPLVFIPYLVLTGRTRMAGRALAAFALSIAVALVVLPGDAWTYWFGGKFTDVSRVTGGTPLAGSGAANQSLRGTVLRIFAGTPHVTVIWLVACLIVGGIGLLLGVRAARRGDEAWGFTLIALTGLLISPVSWTHHWTIAVRGRDRACRFPGPTGGDRAQSDRGDRLRSSAPRRSGSSSPWDPGGTRGTVEPAAGQSVCLRRSRRDRHRSGDRAPPLRAPPRDARTPHRRHRATAGSPSSRPRARAAGGCSGSSRRYGPGDNH